VCLRPRRWRSLYLMDDPSATKLLLCDDDIVLENVLIALFVTFVPVIKTAICIVLCRGWNIEIYSFF
jgi:hypothetical protein